FAPNEIAQTGLSSLPPVIYYSEQLFSILPDCLLFASITALVGAVRKAYQGLVMDVKWSGGDGGCRGN
ncbi:hypothetical protein NUK31_22325, partial [Aeromonas caviae]|uniref:hypothetical protein n=1 Tax=Aeromonas caviae TaxID=648 RepID=UPI00214EB97D